ncbi:MAG: 2-oxo acid dehydrogenase subunit E2 [Erysipelotrichaceae bacterium]|nr:2-oxo acid dehydrogenase subunit E2 [Erysipelotrichaceae bacterium]
MPKDRKDGKLVVSPDPMHDFMPYIMGNRTENEAVLAHTFDMSAVTAYLKKRNDENPQYRFTIFHVVVAALAKTMYLRPHLNRFIAGHRCYERKDITFTFTAKKKFADNAGEFIAIVKAENDGTSLVDQIHDKICKTVYEVRSEKTTDGTSDMMTAFNKIPRPILRLVIRFLNWLVYHDWVPQAIRDVDPYLSSVFISNLGSIKMEANYHHLINWSLNSIFVIANRMYKQPFFNEDGTYEMKDGMNISVTIDERIADGFYFAKSLELFKNILAHPEMLEDPLGEPIDKYIAQEDWFK